MTFIQKLYARTIATKKSLIDWTLHSPKCDRDYKITLSKLPRGRQGFNCLMIITQVYNHLTFACYQMGRPQSILITRYFEIYTSFTHVFQTRTCIFFMQNSRKPGIYISYSSKRSSALYWLHNDSMYAKGFYCNIYCLCDNSLICNVFYPRRTLFDFGEQRKISNLQLELFIVSLRWNSTILCNTMMIPPLMPPMTWRGPFW